MIAETFLSEYEKLKLSVPRVALINTKSENSAYTSYSISNKNVYICMGCEENEDCYYGYWIYTNKDAVDCSFLFNTEISYECIDVRRSYTMCYCQDCMDCRDFFLCFDCIGCSDCFGCIGLRSKQYHIFNVPFSKEEYARETQRLRQEWKNPSGEDKIRRRFEELQTQVPRVYMRQLNNENCTGDYSYNSRNCHWCFDIKDSEDCQYIYNAFSVKNSAHCAFIRDGELLYECVSCFGHNFNFCYVCWGGSNLEFCELCFNCNDCFGCIGLKNKRFCILNKQYSPEEYGEKVMELKNNLKKSHWYGGKLPEVFSQG